MTLECFVFFLMLWILAWIPLSYKQRPEAGGQSTNHDVDIKDIQKDIQKQTQKQTDNIELTTPDESEL
jgi:hypothetical protein